MNTAGNVTGLVEEYRVLFEGVEGDASDSLEAALTHGAEWTPEAAAHLLQLARAYGSFMLRNALAVSLALDVDDGELGF
jgi:hypothetical protein